MKKIYLILIILVGIAGLILISCNFKPGEQANPITIGINEWTGFDPFIVADKLNLFKQNGIAVNVQRFPSATDEMAAIRRGEIQGGGFTFDEVFTLIGAGFKGKVVLVIDYSMGGDMVIGQKGIETISQLTDKTVGFEGTVVGEFLLHRALAKNHVKKESINIINVPASDWLSSFKEQRVDALVCFNPVATQLLNEYDGNLLFSSTDMPFEIIDVLLFSESFYDNNQDAITTILKTWFDTLDYIDTHLDESAQIIAWEKNISPEEYKAGLTGLVAPTLEINKAVMKGESQQNIYKYAQVVIDFMISAGLLTERINTTELFSAHSLLTIESSAESQQEK